MDHLNDIHLIQIDPTSHCNAGCGTCVRFVPETLELQPYLKLEHFPMDVYTRLIEEDIKETNITGIEFNGNWGDACMNPNLIEMCRIARRANLTIHISTNGGVRTPDWWSELAQVIGDSGEVVFCIDGIDRESHALYRARTDYDKIIENMQAFNRAGGESIWIITIFDYNNDQIDRAEQLAKQYGCSGFNARKNYSNRKEIVYPTHTVTLHNVDNSQARMVLWNSNTKRRRNDAYYKSRSPLQQKSQCPWYTSGEIQIDPYATVWPCCVSSQTSYGVEPTGHKYDPITGFTNLAQSPKYSLKEHTLKEILTDKWYTDILNKKVEGAQFSVCVDDCGVENRL
jgi:MoaA/NifB/PqqE/SkfB family radical SAM enzyme